MTQTNIESIGSACHIASLQVCDLIHLNFVNIVADGRGCLAVVPL